MTSELTTVNAPANAPALGQVADEKSFELLQRIAKCLASSSLIPKEYQGNVPNCVVALNMARRLGADPLMVMQNLYVVHGHPSWSAQFLIASFNGCGRYSSIRYKWTGDKDKDTWGCIACATELSTGERLEGSEITIAMAKKEGWHGRKDSKWQSMPEQMLRYRAASWFIRAYAPELSMGMQTVDEITDYAPQVVQPQRKVETLQQLTEQLTEDKIAEDNISPTREDELAAHLHEALQAETSVAGVEKLRTSWAGFGAVDDLCDARLKKLK